MRNGKGRKDVPLYVPNRTGSQWISLDVTGMNLRKKLFQLSDLHRSMDLCGSPWKVDMERVAGIEPA